MQELPDVHFGEVSEDYSVDWRKDPDEDIDDDSERETPDDVVAMLGFDPVGEEDEDE